MSGFNYLQRKQICDAATRDAKQKHKAALENKRYVERAELERGYKVCANIKCEAAPDGAPQALSNFYKNKARADGYDQYCRACRYAAELRTIHQLKDNDKKLSQAAARQQDKKDRQKQRYNEKTLQRIVLQQAMIDKHPELNLSDFYAGRADKIIRDNRYGARPEAVRKAISKKLKGRPGNNPEGIWGPITTGPRSAESRERTAAAMRRRWAKIRRQKGKKGS